MQFIIAFLMLAVASGAARPRYQVYSFRLFGPVNATSDVRRGAAGRRPALQGAVALRSAPIRGPEAEPELEYDDADYETLKKEFGLSEWREMRPGNGTTRAPHGGGATTCGSLFCHVPRKVTVLVTIAVALTLFWCYSGIICYYLPCGWLSRSKLHQRARELLEENRPGRLVDETGRVVEYEPSDHELEAYRRLQEDLQDL